MDTCAVSLNISVICNVASIVIPHSWVSLRFGAGGHLIGFDTRARFLQSLEILKIYSCRDAKSSQAELSSQLVNLPSVRPLMKPLQSDGVAVSMLD